MGVSKLVGKDLESNNQVDSNNRDGFVDFTRDYQSNLSSARNSIHSIRTVTTNADFADTESVARFDPEAYKKNAQKKSIAHRLDLVSFVQFDGYLWFYGLGSNIIRSEIRIIKIRGELLLSES